MDRFGPTGKTGPPFEVDQFSRSEFWLNGSRPRILVVVPTVQARIIKSNKRQETGQDFYEAIQFSFGKLGHTKRLHDASRPLMNTPWPFEVSLKKEDILKDMKKWLAFVNFEVLLQSEQQSATIHV